MKDIPGYENKYAITEEGHVINKLKNRQLNPKSKNGWYLQVVFIKNGVRVPFRIHVLVAKAFIPNPHNYSEVNHKNGIKTDNRVENLEWCNRSQNIKHSFDTLKRIAVSGSRNAKSKLVLDTEMGIYYESIGFAARAKGITRNTLKCALYRNGSHNGLVYA